MSNFYKPELNKKLDIQKEKPSSYVGEDIIDSVDYALKTGTGKAFSVMQGGPFSLFRIRTRLSFLLAAFNNVIDQGKQFIIIVPDPLCKQIHGF